MDEVTLTDEQALFQTILKYPDDDAPRLILSDYLVEHGNADLAEFIRLQVALAKGETINDEKGPMTEAEMAKCAYELLSKHQKEWRGELDALGAYRVDFHRGFPDILGITVGNYLENAARIHEIAPITGLNISNKQLYTGYAQELAASSFLEKINSINMLNSRMIGAAAAALLQSPYIKNLVSLNLSSNFNDEIEAGLAIRALTENPNLHNLTALYLFDNHLGWEEVSRLAHSPNLSNLTTLDLSRNDLRGLRGLASSPYLKKLTSLNLSGCGLGRLGLGIDDEFNALAEGSSLKSLQSLNLSGNFIRDGGAQILAENPYLQNLTTLNLQDAAIRNDGIKALANSPYLNKMEFLDLSISNPDHTALNNRINASGRLALAQSTTLLPTCRIKLEDFDGTLAELRQSMAHVIALQERDGGNLSR